MDQSQFFFCYSKRLSEYLYARNCKPITVAINPTSQNTFSLFWKSDELQQHINEYKEKSC